MHSRSLLALLSLLALGTAIAGGDGRRDVFRQLDELLPTPNVYRTASVPPAMSTGSSRWTMRSM